MLKLTVFLRVEIRERQYSQEKVEGGQENGHSCICCQNFVFVMAERKTHRYRATVYRLYLSSSSVVNVVADRARRSLVCPRYGLGCNVKATY